MRIVGLVTAVIVGAIFFWGLLARENEIAEEKAPERKVGQASQSVATGPEAPESQEPTPPTMEIIYTPETAEPDGLVTYLDNVFVGQVLEAVGHEPWTSTIPGDEKPQTQWSVRVGEVLKSSGEAPVFRGSEVVVNQIPNVVSTGHITEVLGNPKNNYHYLQIDAGYDYNRQKEYWREDQCSKPRSTRLVKARDYRAHGCKRRY